MNRYIPGIRKPVTRQGAETLLLIMLLSFAGSITFTRLLLNLTGFPQIGGGGLHIAHVLWGGLLLFVASLLPLIFANRWAYTLSAALSGVGVGLFIDEVGKFITQNNDYFYPAAAPLIYAFFLMTVIVYFQVRRRVSRDPRAELYRAFDALEDVLDHDLDEYEQADLKARLEYAHTHALHPDVAHLARMLDEFVSQKGLYLAPRPPTLITRLQRRFLAVEKQHFSHLRMRAALAGGLGALSVIELSNLARLLLASFGQTPLEELLFDLMETGTRSSPAARNIFLARVLIEGAAGLMLFAGAFLVSIGKERRGIAFAYLSLLFSLTVINILVFYFDQFSTIAIATMQFAVLLVVLYYRRRFLPAPVPVPQEKVTQA